MPKVDDWRGMNEKKKKEEIKLMEKHTQKTERQENKIPCLWVSMISLLLRKIWLRLLCLQIIR